MGNPFGMKSLGGNLLMSNPLGGSVPVLDPLGGMFDKSLINQTDNGTYLTLSKNEFSQFLFHIFSITLFFYR